MYKIIKVKSDPYKEENRFCYEMKIRELQLISIIKNNSAIMIQYGENSFDIISKSFKYAGGKRITTFYKGSPIGHTDFKVENINKVAFEYLFDGDIIEIIK